ncbi:helix-turn-helix domain-containing protein [Streptomyces chilikensis]|uniref:Helix-turn-helix domain-containing protein n=1 Tax=Streptomyces chilikensis TaxID=1194079 RepID=A0ABV3EQQ5_9ACTN
MIQDVLGLTENESNAYRELLRRPSCSAGELARALEVPEGEAARVMGRLETLGLAARNGEAPGRLSASPPRLALGSMLVRRQNALRLAELELGSLEELYRATMAERSSSDVLDVVRGVEATRQRLEQLQSGARSEILGLVQAPSRFVSTAENSATEAAAAARGVAYRVVLERRMLEEDEGIVEELERAVDAGEEVRVTESVPVKLVIVDRELAMVPMGGRGHAADGVLLIRPSGLLDALLGLFELVWHRSSRLTVPRSGQVVTSTPSALDGTDARIMSLLVAGFTDQAVAARLGLSLRTVQRRVGQLMKLTGAQTRLQLGLQAARLGWA